MAMDKKSLFYLLLGASGLFLVVFAQYLGSISGQRVVLVSTTFENGSLAYLGDISINTSALDPEDGIYLKVRNRLSDLLQMVNGTSKNVRRVASGKFKKGFYYDRDTMALINDDNLLTNPNIVQSSQLYTLSKVSSIDSSLARKSDSTSAPSKNAGDVTSNANIKERSNAAEINGPDSPGRYAMNDSCVSRNTGLEDILCMRRPTFLPDYRNPCWYEAERLRCMPYFHIIGVCKTGTTDLFERLSHHPEVIKNRGIMGKETWFWSWKRYGHAQFYRRNEPYMRLDEFINLFDGQTISSIRQTMANGSVFHPGVTGHGDPMDFYDLTSWRHIAQNDPRADLPAVTTPRLVHHVNPEVRLILIVRDPVERLFSNYLHARFGETSRDFHLDVMSSLQVLRNCTSSRSMEACLYDERVFRQLKTPISGSFYSIHLKEWLSVFPRQQMFITRNEDFAADIAATLLNIFRFLKLDPLPTSSLYRVANIPHYYDTKARRTAGGIRPETRAVLQELFRPYNEELATILGDQRFNYNIVHARSYVYNTDNKWG